MESARVASLFALMVPTKSVLNHTSATVLTNTIVIVQGVIIHTKKFIAFHFDVQSHWIVG